MSTFLQLASFLLLLVIGFLWCIAFWKQRKLAVGVLIGVVLAWPAAAFLRSLDTEHMPIWLPAVPFALVATCLFIFGGLAWYWGKDQD